MDKCRLHTEIPGKICSRFAYSIRIRRDISGSGQGCRTSLYVVVDGITVKVLGTSFNIRAYADENETKVTLLEGKIAAQINDKEYTLTPGKQLKCDKTFGGTSVRTVDPAEIVSWTRGVLHIQKARLQEVANTLKNWYGVNIVLSSGASDIIYTGVVNKEEKLEVFLRRLEEVSNVKCNCNGKFVTIY